MGRTHIQIVVNREESAIPLLGLPNRFSGVEARGQERLKPALVTQRVLPVREMVVGCHTACYHHRIQFKQLHESCPSPRLSLWMPDANTDRIPCEIRRRPLGDEVHLLLRQIHGHSGGHHLLGRPG